MPHRQERVSHAIHRSLTELLESETGDPRLKNVSVTEVQVTGDLRLAKIFYTTREGADMADVQRGLQAAMGFLRRALAKSLDLRFAPELVFAPDEKVAKGERVLHLLDELHKEEKE